MFNLLDNFIYYPAYPRLFIVNCPGVFHSSKVDQLSGILLLFLSNHQQSAVACEQRGKMVHLGQLLVLLLVAATASDPVSLVLVLRLLLVLRLRLPRYLPKWVFSDPALVAPPVLVLGPILFMSWTFCFSSSSICVYCLLI